jgi:hypothetical protein
VEEAGVARGLSEEGGEVQQAHLRGQGGSVAVGLAAEDVQEGVVGLELDHLDELADELEGGVDVAEVLLAGPQLSDLEVEGGKEVDLPQAAVQVGVLLGRQLLGPGTLLFELREREVSLGEGATALEGLLCAHGCY